MALKNNKRVIPSKKVETRVLVASKRRCCLCYFLNGTTTQQKGQIAHLDGDRSNSNFSNLVYLCLNHHDDFDSKTSQSKGFTVDELREYRKRLYTKLGTTKIPSPTLGPAQSSELAFHSITSKHDTTTYTFTVPERLRKPWKMISLVSVAEEGPLLFAYKSPNRADGICRIERISLPDRRTVVICEQIDGNPGMGITNAIEYIAFQVCEQLEIDPQELILIEHYDTWFLTEREWNLVTFKKTPPKAFFEGPVWKPMTEQDWRSLGIHPRQNRTKRRQEPSSSVRGYGRRNTKSKNLSAT